jgi:hypothetical protein
MDTIDDEIKKFSRKWLVDLVRLSTFENLVDFRDFLDAIADVVDDLIEGMWKAKKRRLYQRPPAKTVREFESMLLNYVKSDIKPEERWSVIKLWIEGILLPGLKQTLEELFKRREREDSSEDVYSITKREIEKSLRVLLRRPPGRKDDSKKNERYAQAAKIREDRKWSYKKLAQHLFPKEYATSPRNAAAMVCQGIKRYRSKTTSAGEPAPSRKKTRQRPTVH